MMRMNSKRRKRARVSNKRLISKMDDKQDEED